MDGLTQDGLAYCGFGRGGASNADWPHQEMNQQGRESPRDQDRDEENRQALEYKASLARTIEAEIIPRLMLLYSSSNRGEQLVAKLAEPSVQELEETIELCDLLLNSSVAASTEFVENLIARSTPLEVLYLGLFAPAAKRLGEMWEADLCSFADVTISLSRLQQLMHSLSPAFRSDGELWRNDRRALLVGVPGEQHTLGLFMVSEFFRRAGWDVWNEPPSSRTALAGLVAAERFDVIGLSAGSVTRVDLIAAVVAEVRAASLNKDVAVMVGGPLFSVTPSLAVEVGADGMAADAREALGVAEGLVLKRSARK